MRHQDISTMDWTSAAVSSDGAYQVPAELTVITIATGVLQVGTVITLTASEHVFSSAACRTQPLTSAACCTATTSGPGGGAVHDDSVTGTSQVRAITLKSEVAVATRITIKCTNMRNNRAENTAVTWTIQSSTDTAATAGLPGYTVGAAKVGFDYYVFEYYTSDTCATSLKKGRVFNAAECLVNGANSYKFAESKWTNDNSAAVSMYTFVGNTQCSMSSSTTTPMGVTIPNPMVSTYALFDTCVTKTLDSNGTLGFIKSTLNSKLKVDTTVTKIGVMFYSGEGSSVCAEDTPTTYTVFVMPGICINFDADSGSTFGAFTVQLATDGTVIMTRYYSDEGVTPAATCEGIKLAITMGKAGDGCFVQNDEATGIPWSFCKNEECVIPGAVVSKAIAPGISALTTTVATFGAAVLALA